MAHLDVALTTSVTEDFSIGVVGGLLYQFEDDASAFDDTHDGFRGRSVAIGPLVKYKAKVSETTELDFTLTSSHEVAVENRMKGNAIALIITGQF